MKGASLKTHYLGCEQSGKLYFQNPVSQTVLQALIKNCSGGSSCCLFTWSVEVIMSLFYSAQPPVNTVLFPLIPSIAQSPRALPYSGWPGFPDIYTYLCLLWFLPRYLNSQYLMYPIPCVYIHLGASVSSQILNWIFLAKLSAAEICKWYICNYHHNMCIETNPHMNLLWWLSQFSFF